MLTMVVAILTIEQSELIKNKYGGIVPKDNTLADFSYLILVEDVMDILLIILFFELQYFNNLWRKTNFSFSRTGYDLTFDPKGDSKFLGFRYFFYYKNVLK